jgi:hypothetical protein
MWVYSTGEFILPELGATVNFVGGFAKRVFTFCFMRGKLKCLFVCIQFQWAYGKQRARNYDNTY